MPSKLIIVLNKNKQTGLFRCALWADVPATRQPFYADAGAKSSWTGASVAENTAIAEGQVAERVIDVPVSDGATPAQLRSELLNQQVRFQAEITDRNPWIRYGSFFDGTTWTSGGVT